MSAKGKPLLKFLTLLTAPQVKRIMQSSDIWEDEFYDVRFVKLDIDIETAIYEYATQAYTGQVGIYVYENNIIASFKKPTGRK